MRQLVTIEYWCAKHEKRDASCAVCQYLEATERELDQLRQRRAAIVAELKRRIQAGEVKVTTIQ